MLSLNKLYEKLKTLGYDVAYHHFDEEPTLPFIAYYEDGREYLYADDSNYHENKQMTIEVYTNTHDEEIISKVKSLLDENGISFSLRAFIYIEDEKMYLSDFGFTL